MRPRSLVSGSLKPITPDNVLISRQPSRRTHDQADHARVGDGESRIVHISAPANRSLDTGAETCRAVVHRRTPILTMAAINAGEAGDEVTPTRIWDPSRLTTKCTVRGGEASDATDGCAVKVNVPVQLGFTV
jgi:hypothetical protein